MQILIAIAVGYTIGSIPFAFLLSRRRGVDLRYSGSGNVGATNVLRTSGVAAGVMAMCLDAFKGALAVLTVRRLGAGIVAQVAAGLASVIGHVYPVWLGFHGGKGVATAAGVFGVLAPVALAAATGAFVIVVAVTRYVSAGSLVGALTLAVATAISDAPMSVAAGAAMAAVVIVYKHRGNLARLVAGTERSPFIE